MLDDDSPSSTTKQQNALERKLLASYQELDSLELDDVTEALRLLRPAHVAYLQQGLGKLPAAFASLDASRPWIVFWIVHSLALLGAELPPQGPTAQDICAFLSQCQSPAGGFGGGPGQIPHLAPTYAAVAALVTLGGAEALGVVDRPAAATFLDSMAVSPEEGGGFRVHYGGECDLRACYLALATAHMLGLDKAELAQRSAVVQYIQRCQTHEGGLGGEPGNEAHGGYTFCGVAALALIGQESALDLPALLQWATQRQGSVEGGFNGRTNKLVDGCYSYWQGGLFPILQRIPADLLRISSPAALAANPQPQPPVIPPLPSITPRNPVEQASVVLGAKQAAAQQIINQALQVGDQADDALRTGSERSAQPLQADARVLLGQAGTAQTAAEQAHFNVNMVNCSAAVMYPVPDASDPPFPAVAVQPGMPAVHLGPPLFNYKALQLWILRSCQQSRGGLRDKPGTQADYYHSCYCLSGLAAAQYASNCVMGPRDNLLRRANHLCNVMEDKLEAARRAFQQQGRPCSPNKGPAQFSNAKTGDDSQLESRSSSVTMEDS